MQGAGTNDDTLIRVIVSRSEVDLVQIKQEFQRNHGQTLESWIQSDTSGDYLKMLLALVRGNWLRHQCTIFVLWKFWNIFSPATCYCMGGL